MRTANNDIKPFHTDMVTRSRDLYRNNPYAHRGVDSIVNNTIGAGLDLEQKQRPRVKNDNQILL